MRPFPGPGGEFGDSDRYPPYGVMGDSSMARTWALKRKPFGNHSYFTLRSGWSREAGAPRELWISGVAVVCVLGAVTLFSVHTGPSAAKALVAVRVAQQELLSAKAMLREPLLKEAESRALNSRKTRRCDKSPPKDD